MNKIKQIFLSMPTMAILLLVFALAIATATFIENSLGTESAKVLVYNAKWFEVVLLLLCINLVANIFIFKLYQLKKISIFLFHISFIVIILGSAITRYFGWQGNMHIREGETSATAYSDDKFLSFSSSNGKETNTIAKQVHFTKNLSNKFSEEINIGSETAEVNLKEFMINTSDTIVSATEGVPYLHLVTSREGEIVSEYLKIETILHTEALTFSFNSSQHPADVEFSYKNSKLTMKSKYTILIRNMQGETSDSIPKDSVVEPQTRTMYNTNGRVFVFSEFIPKGKARLISNPTSSETYGPNAVVLSIKYKGKEYEAIVKEDYMEEKNAEIIQMENTKVQIDYGSKAVNIPFSLKLNRFVLERYPASKSPSSYASEITVNDTKTKKTFDYRIFMNNVLDYNGFRFFQSSYDNDEKGTILSVSQDKPGTLVTYIGYFLMSLGMFLALILKTTRFRALLDSKSASTAAKKLIIFLLFVFGTPAFSQTDSKQLIQIDKKHAEKFSHILIQDPSGRIEPLHSLSGQLLMKIARKASLNGMNAEQIFLSMMLNHDYWQEQPLIKVKHPDLKKLIGKTEAFQPFSAFFKNNYQTYLLDEALQAANAKKPSKRGVFEKDLMQVDERINIVYMMLMGEYYRIMPNAEDNSKEWLSPNTAMPNETSKSQMRFRQIVFNYFSTLKQIPVQKSWKDADALVDSIIFLQKEYAGKILPSETKIKTEIFYNKLNPFQLIFPIYMMIGLMLILLQFVKILSGKTRFKFLVTAGNIAIVLLFVVHTAGLGLRWYISGHAPWSDGYESMIYVSWATMFAGFLFAKKSNFAIPATALLTTAMLLVAHLNWMDPEITNLVPVLKSYWLMFHVSIITASYGFLAFGAILGIIVLILMILQNTNNKERITTTIEEITNLNELGLIVGLYLLSIGTFLGGVWANESWGRYWAWDPKETWALVTMLVYSILVHFRMIPGLKSKYAFNLASILSFSCVLMTYFGVNYYLSGLHSYAKGESTPIPVSVYIAVLVVSILASIAYWKKEKMLKN